MKVRRQIDKIVTDEFWLLGIEDTTHDHYYIVLLLIVYVQFIISRTTMEGRHNLVIFLLGSLLMPLAVLAGPFLPLDGPSDLTPALDSSVCLSESCGRPPGQMDGQER